MSWIERRATDTPAGTDASQPQFRGDAGSGDARALIAGLITGACGTCRAGGREHEAPLIDDLLAGLPAADPDSLAVWLLGVADADDDRRAALTDVIGRAAGSLAARNRPLSPPEQAVWHALVTAADRLNGGGAQALGRLPFVSDRLLELLAAEARRGLFASVAGGRAIAQPGRMLAVLAASRKLRDAVGEALGITVVPTHEAVFEYDPPGSHVRTHLDSRDYQIVFHLVVEHAAGCDSGVSRLVVHRPDAAQPDLLALGAGDGVALRGRGTIHSWEPLGDDESRLLAAVGFVQARPAAATDGSIAKGS